MQHLDEMQAQHQQPDESDNADRANSPSILNRWITASRNFLLGSLLEIWVTSMGTSVGFVLALVSQTDVTDISASVFLIAASFGCFIFGFIMSTFSRKIGLFAIPALSAVGCILISCTDYFGMLLAGGIVLGVAVGGAFVVSPIYVFETVEKERTWQLVLRFHFTFTIGMFLAFVVGYYQRSLIFLYAFPLLVPALPAGFLPESPLFLLAENREKDALQALRFIHRKSSDFMNKLDELKIRLPSIKIPSCSSMKRCTTWKTLGVIWGLLFFQQFSGIMAIILHNRYILNLALSNIKSDSIIISISQVVGTAVAALLITIKLGRRRLLAWSIVLVMIVQLSLFIYLVLYIPHVAHSTVDIGWFPVFVLSCFVAVYSLGLGLIPWITMIELLHAGLTVFGFSAASAFHFIVAFAVVISFPHIGIAGFLFISFIFGFFALVFVGLLPTEGEIQAMLDEQSTSSIEDGNANVVTPPPIA